MKNKIVQTLLLISIATSPIAGMSPARRAFLQMFEVYRAGAKNENTLRALVEMYDELGRIARKAVDRDLCKKNTNIAELKEELQQIIDTKENKPEQELTLQTKQLIQENHVLHKNHTQQKEQLLQEKQKLQQKLTTLESEIAELRQRIASLENRAKNLEPQEAVVHAEQPQSQEESQPLEKPRKQGFWKKYFNIG